MTNEEKAIEIMNEELKRAPKAFWNRTAEGRLARKNEILCDLERKEISEKIQNGKKALYQKLNEKFQLKHYVNGRIYIGSSQMKILLKEAGFDEKKALKGFWIDRDGRFEAIDRHTSRWDEPMINEQVVSILIDKMVYEIIGE